MEAPQATLHPYQAHLETGEVLHLNQASLSCPLPHLHWRCDSLVREIRGVQYWKAVPVFKRSSRPSQSELEGSYFESQGSQPQASDSPSLPIPSSVILKVVWPKAFSQDPMMWQFQAELEIKALSEVEHPVIQKVWGWGEATRQECWVIVLEKIEGLPLSEVIQKKPLDLVDARALFMSLAQGLHACHQNQVLHRKITSKSILLTQKGVRLADFEWIDEVHGEDGGAGMIGTVHVE